MSIKEKELINRYIRSKRNNGMEDSDVIQSLIRDFAYEQEKAEQFVKNISE